MMSADSIDLLLLIIQRLPSVITTMMAMTFSGFNDIDIEYIVYTDGQVRRNE